MKYRSDILRTVHESATDMFAIGAISEAKMREFDEGCLVDAPKAARKPKVAGAKTPTRAPKAAGRKSAPVFP